MKQKLEWKISPEVREIFKADEMHIRRKPVKSRKIKQKYQYVKEVGDCDILEHFHIVKHYFTAVKKIRLPLLEILLALYPKQFFTNKDYNFIIKQYTYNRITLLEKKGYIVLFSKDVNKLHGVYCLSTKAKHIVKDFYACLSGEKKMTEDYTINPIFSKNPSTMDKKKAKIITALNKLEVPEYKKPLFK